MEQALNVIIHSLPGDIGISQKATLHSQQLNNFFIEGY